MTENNVFHIPNQISAELRFERTLIKFLEDYLPYKATHIGEIFVAYYDKYSQAVEPSLLLNMLIFLEDQGQIECKDYVYRVPGFPPYNVKSNGFSKAEPDLPDPKSYKGA